MDCLAALRSLIILFLAFLTTTAVAGPDSALRVVTYNVVLGYPISLEKKAPTARLRRRLSMAHLLETHSALRDFDILGTQEICTGRHGEQLEYFRNILRARGLPVYSRFAASNPSSTDTCRTGQMILSRYPIEASGSFQIPLLRPGGKVVLWADIKTPQDGGSRLVRVYNLHLDNRGKSFFAEKGRLKQIKAVLQHYLDWRTEHPDQAAIILGDFNSLKKLYDFWEREAAIIETMKYLTPSLPQFKVTHVSLHQMDWIFYDKLELSSSRVVRKLLSDHFPVVADFK